MWVWSHSSFRDRDEFECIEGLQIKTALINSAFNHVKKKEKEERFIEFIWKVTRAVWRLERGIWYLTRSTNGHITPLSEPSSDNGEFLPPKIKEKTTIFHHIVLGTI